MEENCISLTKDFFFKRKIAGDAIIRQIKSQDKRIWFKKIFKKYPENFTISLDSEVVNELYRYTFLYIQTHSFIKLRPINIILPHVKGLPLSNVNFMMNMSPNKQAVVMERIVKNENLSDFYTKFRTLLGGDCVTLSTFFFPLKATLGVKYPTACIWFRFIKDNLVIISTEYVSLWDLRKEYPWL